MTAKTTLRSARSHSLLLGAGTTLCALGILIGTLASNVEHVGAAAGQIFKLQTSDNGSTFYVGRCFRTNVLMQTDSLNANSADVIIPYNSVYMAPYSNSGCTITATALNTDGLFPSYPSNAIASGRIEVTGYDPSGTAPVNTGAAPAHKMFGHIYWKVLAASGSAQLGFDFTLGSTTDTNIAESGGNGSDVLDAVEELSLVFAADTTAPTFSSLSPASGATGVSVTSDLSYTVSDAGAGVNSGSLTLKFGGTTQTVAISSCTKTNSNRVPACNATVDLSTLSYKTTYVVSATGSDLMSTPNVGTQTWSFTTEDDDDAPYVENLDPTANEQGVAVSDNIVFRVKDFKDNGGSVPGLGVDTSTIFVTVTVGGDAPITYDSGDAEFSASGIAANRLITINPASNFPQNTVVQVSIEASDLHSPPNAMSTYSYQFTTTDSTAPTISNYVPAQSATSVEADTNISFTIADSGAGVDIPNTSVTIEGVAYTSASGQWSAVGNTGSTTITINPSSNFSGGQVVDVSISTRDLASTPNTASASYSFTIASACATCSVDTESPARYTTNATLSNTITFHVKDTGDGIDDDTIRAVIIGSGAAVPVSPLTLTGASTQMNITGTSADYTVTITLAAAISENVPYSITINASDINGLSMSTVSYTFMKDTTTSVQVAAVCPTCKVCTETVVQSGGGSNRGNRNTIQEVSSSDLPIIVARRQLPGSKVPYEEVLSQEIAKGVYKCYVDDPVHASAPEPLTPYQDLPAGAWYEKAVAVFVEKGVLEESQKLFRGEDPALRAEVAKLLVLLSKDDRYQLPSEPSFRDAPADAWFFAYVEEAARRGWMLGYDDCYGKPDCTIRPAARVTRAEAATMIVRYFNLKPTGKSPAFTDVSNNVWYANEIQTAGDYCILQGRTLQSTVEAGRAINRAEVVVMLYRAISKLSYERDCPRTGTPVSALPGAPLAGSIMGGVFTGPQHMSSWALLGLVLGAFATEYALRKNRKPIRFAQSKGKKGIAR